MVVRWAQELLGYYFSVIHRPARMMIDVDKLPYHVDNMSSQYAHISLLLSSVDCKTHPFSCTSSIAGCVRASKIKPDNDGKDPLIHILTTSTITGYNDSTVTNRTADITLPITRL